MALRILHILRAPLGGVMRHVADLIAVQHRMGHEIGLITASNIGGAAAEARLQVLRPCCSLAIHRMPMDRLPAPSDIGALCRIRRLCRELAPDIVHGHGAKGGAFAALVGRSLARRAFYTLHGGSLHYRWTSPVGALSLGLEKLLRPLYAGLIFVCEWERRTYERKIGIAASSILVHNGLWDEEFTPVPPRADAADLLFIGELRTLKGLDILLRALALLAEKRRVTAYLVGDGPQRGTFERLARNLGLADRVTFAGAQPARLAMSRGRVLVLPSRAEALPYIVLEAAAASLPVIASATGGVPEILPPARLVPPADPVTLAAKIAEALDHPEACRQDAQALATALRGSFSARRMAEEITRFYAR